MSIFMHRKAVQITDGINGWLNNCCILQPQDKNTIIAKIDLDNGDDIGAFIIAARQMFKIVQIVGFEKNVKVFSYSDDVFNANDVIVIKMQNPIEIDIVNDLEELLSDESDE